jgi:hypothetical protein
MQKVKFICCEVLKREAEYCLKESPFDVDIVYTKKSSHRHPEKLNRELQELIDKTNDADVIILGFGLCGNTITGLKAGSIPLVVPRAHDCCTLYLGSRDKYARLFEENKSMPWGCTGYSEIEYEHDDYLGYSREYEDFVEKYGEDNAKYIWEVLHPESRSEKAIFIKIPETFSQKVYEDFVSKAGEENRRVETVPGDMGIIRKLVEGDWDEDFQIVQPGHQVLARYDSNEIIGSIL